MSHREMTRALLNSQMNRARQNGSHESKGPHTVKMIPRSHKTVEMIPKSDDTEHETIAELVKRKRRVRRYADVTDGTRVLV